MHNKKVDKIVNDPKEVTEIFSNFFVNVAKDIGDKNIKIDKTHPSINKIETNRTNKDKLFFKPINENFVTKQINKLNIKKATGYDGISPKIIKFAQPVITNPINVLINKSIDQSVFPEKLKATRYPSFLKRIIVLIKVITALSVSCQPFLNFMKELYLIS